MSYRSLAALCTVIAVAALAPVSASGQGRTPWGDPDLQGVWTNTTTTPLQRPDDLEGKQALTAEEYAARDRERAERISLDRAPREGDTGVYNDFWLERGRLLNKQTSLLVDPPDGKLPALTPKEEQLQAKRSELSKLIRAGEVGRAGPEDLNLYERCITRGLPGSMMPGFYNHNYQILQTPGYVVVMVEMIHDARIIPLDGRPHVDGAIGQWLGSSRGRWEGDTLVVETTNLPDIGQRNSLVFGTREAAHVVERFTRVDADTLDYQVTVTDSTAFTRPWTASIPMTTLGGPIFEYGCHEGNYSIANILRGERVQEIAAAAAATQGGSR